MTSNEKMTPDSERQHTNRTPSTCSTPNCCNQIDRRDFLKVVGLGAASTALSQPFGPNAFADSGPDIRHFVPADKQLDPAWVRSLFQRGVPEVFAGKDLATIGMPVGGIGAGQLYLLGDGTLGVWQIFNRHHFTGYGATNYQYRTPDSPLQQGFSVNVTQNGNTKTRKLNIEDFPGVTFCGEYPIGRVTYRHDSVPVKVEMEAFSPFIPLNAKDSALPATLFHITVENTSGETIRTNISAWLENGVCFHSALDFEDLRRTRIINDKSRTLIVHTAEKDPNPKVTPPRPKIVLADFEGDSYGDWTAAGTAFGDKPAPGTLKDQSRVSGYVGKGLANSFLGGDGARGTLTSPPFAINRHYINFLIGGGNNTQRTCINLLVDGKIVRNATARNNEKLTWQSWKVKNLRGKQARIQIVDDHTGGWGHINVDQIELADKRQGGPSGPLEEMEDFGSMVIVYDGTAKPADPSARTDDTYPLEEKRTATMRTDDIELAAGEKHTFTFVLGWFFPNHKNGHQYNNWFDNAVDVAHYVLDHHDRLATDTRKWRDTYYDSTLPYWLLNRIGSTVSYLATGTCQWWGNGRFWAWEGVGCCHGTCTHVWNYAHASARLFPELERSVRQMQDLGIALQEDGKVSFRGEPDGNYAADGQAGTILKCYREHLMSADNGFLEQNWPKIKKALGYLFLQDPERDGMIVNSQHNTYDINFHGPNTMVGSLYLAALHAVEQMAHDLGDTEYAAKIRKIHEQGRRFSEEQLFNGEYFIQIVDLKLHDDHQYGQGCLSDQLFGQGWAHQLGLGYIYRPDYVKKALASVYSYNWAPDISPQNKVHKPERWFIAAGEAGLFTCTWPKSEHLEKGVRYKNEVWTGIEYQVAGHMIWEGMLTEALAIIRAIHDRYHPARHNPYNEIECGDHYARALASWGCFIALAGYNYNGPKARLAFNPRITPSQFRTAFTAAQGWGTFQQTREAQSQHNTIQLNWGQLPLNELTLNILDDITTTRTKVTIDNDSIPVETRKENNRFTISFPQGITLRQDQTLEIRIG